MRTAGKIVFLVFLVGPLAWRILTNGDGSIGCTNLKHCVGSVALGTCECPYYDCGGCFVQSGSYSCGTCVECSSADKE